MVKRSWHRAIEPSTMRGETTRARVIETIDAESPKTKADLATALDVSEHRVSELLGDLKADGLVSKGYVVDAEAVYASAKSISELHARETGETGSSLLTAFRRLDDASVAQYEAVRGEFLGESPDRTPTEVEPLTNERCAAVVHDLKSYTLTTAWPANRIAADLAVVATDLELIGDYACFIHDTIARSTVDPMGTVGSKVEAVFDAGLQIHDYFESILFEGAASRFDRLQEREATVHRHLDELFELLTVSDGGTFSRLVSITRALERAIYYWVNAAELTIQVMTGIEPTHLDI